MTQAELFSFLSMMADLVESKAKTVEEAAGIIRQKAGEVKPTK